MMGVAAILTEEPMNVFQAPQGDHDWVWSLVPISTRNQLPETAPPRTLS